MYCKFCGSNKTKSTKKIQSHFVTYNYPLYQCNGCKRRFFHNKEHDIENLYEIILLRIMRSVVSDLFGPKQKFFCYDF